MNKNGESSSTEDYNSPSWAYLQADKNGQARAFKQILQILDIEKDH